MKRLISFRNVCVLLFSFALLPGACTPPTEPNQRKETKSQQQARQFGKPEIAPLFDAMAAVESLHQRMGPPLPGDWLESNPEPGQTFVEYIQSNPVTPQGKRKFIYVQPLGDFTQTEMKIVKLVAEYMGVFFNLPTKIVENIPLKIIPPSARRVTPSGALPENRTRRMRREQILTTYVLSDVLQPKLPDDATALIAFTTSDLWPGEGWNYLFGQALLRQRVGLWSIHRFGDPEASDDAYRLCLIRAMKLATHETGHMFSMQHCTKYECNLSGTNHLGETDRRPLEVCPECMAKICWATGTKPRDRFQKLAEFFRANSLEAEQRIFDDSIKALDGYSAN